MPKTKKKNIGLFYSHDAHGLGHFSRNLKVAKHFAEKRKQDRIYF